MRGPILVILNEVANSLVTNFTLSGAHHVNNSYLCKDCKYKEYFKSEESNNTVHCSVCTLYTLSAPRSPDYCHSCGM